MGGSGRPELGFGYYRPMHTRISPWILAGSISGVTRDRHYAKAEWIGRDYQLVDTGGVVPFSDDIFERAIREQAHLAIDEADVILFVVDVSAGIHPLDQEIANILRKANKKVLLLVNKTDNMTREQLETHEFYELGLGDPVPVSAISGRGVGDFINRRLWSVAAASIVQGATLTGAQFTDRTAAFAPVAGAIGMMTSFGEDDLSNLYIVDYDGEIFMVDELDEAP